MDALTFDPEFLIYRHGNPVPGNRNDDKRMHSSIVYERLKKNIGK